MNQFSMPGFDTLASRSSGGNGRGKRPDVVVVDRAKSLGAHAIGAAAAGKMIGEALPHAQAAREVVRKAGRTGMLAGAALGAGEFARKRLMEARQRKQLMKTSEAMGLPQQSSKNTGKLKQMVRKSAGPVAVERKAGGALKGFHHG